MFSDSYAALPSEDYADYALPPSDSYGAASDDASVAIPDNYGAAPADVAADAPLDNYGVAAAPADSYAVEAPADNYGVAELDAAASDILEEYDDYDPNDVPADQAAYEEPASDDMAMKMMMNAIPGIPGEDYPISPEVPESGFSCDGQVDGGYYADPEAECQVFHICANDGQGGLSQYSFLCPNGTIFNQNYFICDWWFNFDCAEAEALAAEKNGELAAAREAATLDAAASENQDSYAAPSEAVDNSYGAPEEAAASDELGSYGGAQAGYSRY